MAYHTGMKRSNSWTKGRHVSWDEMGSLGLHKALNEYYKMTTPKGTDSRQRGKERKSSLASIVLPLILQPIPVTPERLAAAFSRAVHFSTLVLHHTVVITVPLCIWLVFSAFLVVPGSSSVCSSSLARLHRNLNLPDFIGQDLESWHMQTSSLLAACLLLFCLILAEKAMLTSAAAKVAAVRKSLRPEVLEMHYIGWQLPPVPSHHVGHGGSSSDEEGHHGELLQKLARQAAVVCENVYGDNSSPQDVSNYDQLKSFVIRLCHDAGVKVDADIQRTPSELLDLLQQAKHAIGVQ